MQKKTIKRSGVVDATVASGNLVRVATPKFISMVGHPANQTAFKTVREDNTPGAKPMTTRVTRTRTKRSDSNPVLRLAFPPGTTQDNVNETLTAYGLEGYTISEVEGVMVASRSDLQTFAKTDTVDIKLTGSVGEAGIVATVARASTPDTATEQAREDTDKANHIAITSLEFDPEMFSREDVAAWLETNKVDGSLEADQNSDNHFVVKRGDVAENAETRMVELEDGVVATVVRADQPGVPEGFVAVVSEAAYGNWGWGQLDFSAMMADIAFCELVEDGVWRLRRVLENIMFSSQLPIDQRKNLVNNALSQFGAFVGNLMDSLPRQLLVSLAPVARSANHNLENQMSKANSGAGTTTQTTPAATAATTEQVSRAEFDSLKESIEKLTEAVARAAAPAKAEPAAEVEPAKTDAAPLTRADITAAFAEVVKPVTERLEKLEGTTVMRSAPAVEQKVAPATRSADPVVAKRQDQDAVFSGALPGIRRK